MTAFANPRMGQLSQRPQVARPPTDDIPKTDDVANLTRKDRASARKIAQFFWKTYEDGMVARRVHSLAWVKIRSIMRGVHYFRVQNGVWQPIVKKANEIRGVVPLMEPLFRWELGRLNANRVGVTVTPKMGMRKNPGWKASRAEMILNHWINEAKLQDVHDDAGQHLLYYGSSWFYRYADAFRQNAFVQAIPAPEIFPVPCGAVSPEDCDGFMRVKLVSREWLEMQDAAYERQYGVPRKRPMTKEAAKHSTTMSASYPGLGGTDLYGESMEGAVAIWIWMKPNKMFDRGEQFFMLNDTMYGYEELPFGEVPLEPVYYTKKPDDFWATGFCAPLISMQKEINRQWTSIVKSARYNRPTVGYDPEAVDIKDIHTSESGWVGLRGDFFDEKRQPWHVIPPIAQGKEVGAVLNLAQRFARSAVGHESDIIYGMQEGRTEGGPATTMLNTNAQAALQPTVDRMYRAYQRTFPAVLDMLRHAWPEQKTVHVVGPHNLGREMTVAREEIPESSEVEIQPLPLMPDGRNAMLRMLFEMRGMPGDDGVRPMLTEREMRRSLQQLAMNPPGIELSDKAEDRIAYRIGELINDGQQPAARTVGQFRELEWEAFRAEDHRKAIGLLKDKILDPGFEIYSPAVRWALLHELEAHVRLAQGVHPSDFDDDDIAADGEQAERHLYTAEQDIDTQEGQMAAVGM